MNFNQLRVRLKVLILVLWGFKAHASEHIRDLALVHHWLGDMVIFLVHGLLHGDAFLLLGAQLGLLGSFEGVG